MEGIDRRSLSGHWVHSHEEDSPGEVVYRPESFAFPPSRGRSAFDLNPDGTMVQLGPSPTDQTASREGRWELQDDGLLALYPADSDTPQRIGTVAALSPDKLVIRKVAAG